MDDLTPDQRHMNMSHIRSSETKPETLVRKYLFSQGLRYRKNVKALPGKPDIVLPNKNFCRNFGRSFIMPNSSDSSLMRPGPPAEILHSRDHII